jgi:hypothetical protein
MGVFDQYFEDRGGYFGCCGRSRYRGHAEICPRAAQGTEAGTAETVKQGSVHDGPVAESDAPNQINSESSHDIR